MTAKSIFSLKQTNYNSIDERLKPFLKGWQLVQNYKGQTVHIPGTWNSEIFITKYFEVIKEKGESNYSENGDEDEIGLVLECGWQNYDSEAMIILWITGKAVKDKSISKVSTEIIKLGGSDMQLYFNDRLITSFEQDVWYPYNATEKTWFGKRKIIRYHKKRIEKSKIWIDDISKY